MSDFPGDPPDNSGGRRLRLIILLVIYGLAIAFAVAFAPSLGLLAPPPGSQSPSPPTLPH